MSEQNKIQVSLADNVSELDDTIIGDSDGAVQTRSIVRRTLQSAKVPIPTYILNPIVPQPVLPLP